MELFKDGEGFNCYAGHKLVRHHMSWLIPHIPETRTQQVHDLKAKDTYFQGKKTGHYYSSFPYNIAVIAITALLCQYWSGLKAKGGMQLLHLHQVRRIVCSSEPYMRSRIGRVVTMM